jgi:FkbM family methyltransferase
MTIRDSIRRLRLYYQSWPLLRQAFFSPLQILLFPFAGQGRFAVRRDGMVVEVPRANWNMLPTAARCVQMGARPEWREDGLHVKTADIELVGPADAKEIATFFREVFIDDEYHLARHDLAGRAVIDVGAFIGDTAVAFACRGAQVYAFEPVSAFRKYIEPNASLNGVADKITIHAVGLSDCDRTVTPQTTDEPSFTLVNAAEYLRQTGIGNPYLLKLDCEGCEYDLFASADFWTALRPQHILMEFHRGADSLVQILRQQGYQVEPYSSSEQVGYLFARLEE